METQEKLHSQAFESDLAAQHEYVEQIKGTKGQSDFPLVATEAFVRGMRDSGYKSTATSIDEFIDNSIQADATRIDVLAIEGEAPGRRGAGKPIDHVFVIDDGHGMEPDMMRAAVRWGGTHRENDRSGLGRYGFGLPSAAVSMTERYTIYSKIPDGAWNKLCIDLRDIAHGQLTNPEGHVVAPHPKECDLPDHVTRYLKDNAVELECGTVIHVENPDRLTAGFRRLSSFEQKLMEHIGLIYRKAIRDISIAVNGKKVEAVDPLFTTPGCRYYDIGNGVTAMAQPELTFRVKNDEGVEGVVRCRFSVMHPKFQVDSGSNKNHKGRLSVISDNQAFFIVCRAGRQIDLVTTVPDEKPWSEKSSLVTYDRNWAIEVDFEPVLDELFGITVNKQQVKIQDRMWDILKAQGVPAIIRGLSKKFGELRKADQDEEPGSKGGDDAARPSEDIMQKAETFKAKKTTSATGEKKKLGEKKLLDDAAKQAEKEKRPVAEVVKELLDMTSLNRYVVEFESNPGAPFYRPEQYGGQMKLWINRSHRFFDDVYNAPGATKRQKTALELVLFVLADSEADAVGDRERFYERERAEWSQSMATVLSLLDQEDPVEEHAEATEEDAQAVEA